MVPKVESRLSFVQVIGNGNNIDGLGCCKHRK